MSDLAKGSVAGFIFQFEIALLELSQLNANESISIEKVDDVGKEDDKGTYLCTIQAKHSICLSGSNFGTTSVDLWKTINNWIDKVKAKILDDTNEFIAVTNQKTPNNSIIRDFNKLSFDDLFQKIIDLRSSQQIAYDEKIKLDPAKGKIIKQTISRLEKVISHKSEFKVIVQKFRFNEKVDAKEEFLNRTFLNSLESDDKKNDIYQKFCGWITETSFENWKQNEEAVFSKSQFDKKYAFIISNHTLIEGIFRTKRQLNKEEIIDVNRVKRNELFIKQIEDIDRLFNDEIIRDAILDYIMSDIEIAYIITNKSGTIMTKSDFQEFQEKCFEKWNDVKKKHIRKAFNKYSEDEIIEISCNIYDEIMQQIKVDFQDSYTFNDTNRYIQNGTFLKLSNVPKIGWHPQWEIKYKNNG
ncbi:ABC-three component system protein [uncultured Flavobacterium sp.]|uniref:ABC-three component system protein n=1 Tax=uncultured Flavobacterium sp. TaxID=165435 RepID=UPI00292D4BA5|nr:ABC-three component system protein [uncultured Flavobacterium sp.]